VIKKNPWIHAWSDSVAGVNCQNQQMVLADLKDDGDYKLLIADMNKKLKIYMGTNVIHDQVLEEKPVALEVFYDSTKKPMLPLIAVAAGSELYLFRNTKPFSKF
jgi:Bardet-Biedl syndrome 1 protein